MLRILKWSALLLFLFWLFAVSPLRYVPVIRHIFAIFDSSYVSSENKKMQFSRDLWMEGKACYRVGMASRFQEEGILDGMKRGEVVKMLGKPDIDRAGDEGTRWLLGYQAKGLFDESLWLALTIDADGSVHGACVLTSWKDPRQEE